MFTLDRSKNDTSVTLDLLRAMAAQVVCVGHAMNFGKTGYTYLPNDGVLLFFILSGFLIAYTLDSKSRSNPSYSLVDFAIERFARIYTAYLPAILLIGIVTILAEKYGLAMQADPTDLKTYLGSLAMMQNVPFRWGVTTFGTAGHLTSVAVEYHIYFFVGAIYFLMRGQNVLVCCIVAVLFSRMPLAYFSRIPDLDHTLFVLWLLGFASYYVVKSVGGYGNHALLFTLGFPVFFFILVMHRMVGGDEGLGQYPMLTFCFFCIVMISQSFKLIPDRVGDLITKIADYSFSLFLIHLTILRVVFAVFPGPSVARTLSAIVASNVLAIVFALLFERRYHAVASAIKVFFGRPSTNNSVKLENKPLNAT